MTERCYFCQQDIRLKGGGWYYYTRFDGQKIFCKECSQQYKEARLEYGSMDFPEEILARWGALYYERETFQDVVLSRN